MKLALYALEFIGVAFIVAVMIGIALYAIMLGLAVISTALVLCKPSKQMQPRCPKCDSAKVFDEKGYRICTNCGEFQSGVSRWQ